MNKNIMNPVFYERTKDGEVFYDIQSRLIKDRVIVLCEPVTQDVAGIISSLLFMLNNESPEEKISIWLNTPGGDAHAFFAIYDMIQMIEAPVETVCVGIAMSAGALLLASGTKGKRLATPNAKIMIHELQLSLMPGGTATQVAIEHENIAKMKDDINKVLARHTGQYLEDISKDCEYDKYMTAQEALDYGIIDNIIPISKNIPPLKTKNSAHKTTSNSSSISKKTGKKTGKKISKKKTSKK